jgi:predicted O-methyltransferase YrrM
MKYTNSDVESSYKANNIGRTLYDLVLEKRPKIIIEFGVLYGYSTIAMAMALDEIGEGHIYAYDLFENYQYKHSTKSETQKNIDRYGVARFVTLGEADFDQWLLSPEPFDLLHVDISNTGDTIEPLYEATKERITSGSTVLFEGGSKERDNVEWMKKYGKKNMRDTYVPYEVINKNFPSLSMIRKSI